MKISTFNFADPEVDTKINQFLTEHENDLDPKGMYIDVSSRIAFVYDDEELEDKLARMKHRVLKEKLLNEYVLLVQAEQNSWEARRGLASGTVKQEDVDRITNLEAVSRAKVDYLKEELNGFALPA